MCESEYPRYDDILDYHQIPNTVPTSRGFYGQHDHPMRRRPPVTEQASPDLNDLWRRIVTAIPSKHLRFQKAVTAFGFRRYLAETAAGIAKTGGRVRYLEVGVRRGHSLAFVCLAAAQGLEYADGVDLWIDGYGGEHQHGLGGVMDLLAELGVETPRVTLHSGDSHDLLPLMTGAGGIYNLILVDGDHTAEGARRDLDDCWEMLECGGVLVFDDLSDGPEGDLGRVWIEFVGDMPQGEATWQADYRATPPYSWIRKS